jgi:hypothetical protein
MAIKMVGAGCVTPRYHYIPISDNPQHYEKDLANVVDRMGSLGCLEHTVMPTTWTMRRSYLVESVRKKTQFG